MRINKLTILLSSLFVLFFLTSAYAEDKLYTTPYFQVKLPNALVLRKVETLHSKNTIGKVYLYTARKDDKVDYLFGIFVEDLSKKNLKDIPNFLLDDVKQSYLDYAEKHDRSLKDSDGIKNVKDVKIGNIDFKVLRTPGSRMETLAAVNKGQFYRVLLIAEDPNNMNMLHKQVTETLTFTNTRVTPDIQ